MRGAKGRRVSENASAPVAYPTLSRVVPVAPASGQAHPESDPSLTGPPRLLCEIPLEADTWNIRAGLHPAWPREADIGSTHILCGG